MKTDFKFSNLCGTVFKSGNLLFTPDGNTLISPVGNRISVFDLVASKSYTLPFENRKDIARICISPTASLLISVDVDGRALLINFQKRIILHRHNFKQEVRDIQFSPNGKYIAVTHGNMVQVWHCPGFHIEFQPFVLYKTYTGHHDLVTSISWSSDSEYFLSTSKDMTARLFPLDRSDFAGVCLAGHNDVVLGAWFSKNMDAIYTISRDGAAFEWKQLGEKWSAISEGHPRLPRKKSRVDEKKRPVLRYKSSNKFYFNQNHAKVFSASFHPVSGLIAIGFDSGIFGLWELPEFVNIQTLSITQNKIDTSSINCTGEWIAFGSSKLGQLLVWEWQSESYVLKQQGHEHDMSCMAYSNDGQFIVTGGDDGKVKLWSAQTGFCIVTFTEHSGAVKAVTYSQKKQVAFSASLDGTVRAFDLLRYRNFRTFTSPTPEQFNCIAVDSSTEVVCAASFENFDIYMWSVQTGKLLEIVSGHEGPISCISFSPITGQVVSGSWDQTVRTWDVYSRSKSSEVLEHTSEVLAIAFSPNGQVLASTTLDGNISFWSVETGNSISIIEGRKDITGGRCAKDLMSLDRSASGKYFSSLCFTSDGRGVLAGGNSKYVCLYDVSSKSLLKKFAISSNLSLDRMIEHLNSKNMTEAGPKDLIDDDAENSDLEDRVDKSLPGVQSGAVAARKIPEARTNCVKFSPTGRSWAAASSEGLIIYSVDETINFDPFDLDIEVNPTTIRHSIKSKEFTKALIGSFRLGEQELIDKVYNSIPSENIEFVVKEIGSKYFQKFLTMLNRQFDTNPRLELHLDWTVTFLKHNGTYLRNNSESYSPSLRALHKYLSSVAKEIVSLYS